MPSSAYSVDNSAGGQAAVQALPAGDALAGLDLQSRAAEAAALLKALANPDRLLLLCQLVDAERSVAELGALTGIGQPSLSQQLGVLRGERLVATRRDGRHVRYSVASPEALALLQTLHGLFCVPVPAVVGAGAGAGAVRHAAAVSSRVRMVSQ